MLVIWSASADSDLKTIARYIASDNLDYALIIYELLYEAGNSLALFPKKGKQGRRADTRELVVHEHYIIIYELNQDAVLITAVLHTSRMWPPISS